MSSTELTYDEILNAGRGLYLRAKDIIKIKTVKVVWKPKEDEEL